MAENRINRELETRERTVRKKAWTRPEVLPSPNPEPGYDFHWVRVSTQGQVDATNVSSKLREGWEPVKAKDHPELKVMSDYGSRFDGNVEVGGLLLCKNTRENVEARQEYIQEMTDRQMESVDNNYMRENDPRMPVLRPEKKTKVSFGSGNT